MNFVEHIQKVRKIAFQNGVKANTIFIDKEVAKTNGFTFLINPELHDVPTMFLGLDVHYSENLSDELGINSNFALFENKKEERLLPKTLADYSTDELLYEIKRRTVCD